MSFLLLTMDEEAVMLFERMLTGADVPSETMETSAVALSVVSFEKDKKEEGFDKEGLETAAVQC